MKELFEILCGLSEDKRNIIIENLDESVSKELLTELKGRAEGPWKSMFKYAGGKLATDAAVTLPMWIIAGVLVSPPMFVWPIVWGVTSAMNINTAYYQCKRIKNKKERLLCQKKFVEFLIVLVEKAKKKVENERQIRKLNRALKRYKKAIDLINVSLHRIEKKTRIKENDTSMLEATGSLRLILPISLDSISPVLGSRIDRMWHYCREFPRGAKRYNCLLKVVVEMKKILQAAIANKDKNSKEYRKVSERIGRLEALERRYKDKLIELT